MNFWLFKQIPEVPNSGETVSNLNVEKFHKLWKIIIYKISSKLYDVCMPESKKYNKELYQHLKDLFDFIEDHDTIKKEIEEGKETKEPEKISTYCEYVKKAIPLYEAFKGLCTTPEINKCTHCIKDYQKYDPSALLEKSSCDKKIKEKGNQDESIKQEIKRLQESPEDNPVLYSTNDKAYDASDLIPYLMNLLKDGLSYIGIDKIYNYIPFLQNIISLEKFSVIVASTILFIGGLILYSILHKCFPHFSCLNILRRRRRRGMNAFEPAQQLMPGMLDFQNPMFGNMQSGAPYGMPYQAMQYGA